MATTPPKSGFVPREGELRAVYDDLQQAYVRDPVPATAQAHLTALASPARSTGPLRKLLVVGGIAGGLLVGSSFAAAAGVLPDPVQRAFAGAAEAVGIVLPTPAEAGPGQSEDAPGQGGDAPGQSEDAPGQGGDAPGQSEDAPGQSEDAPGQGGDARGQSADAPGQGGDAPGKSEDAPGKGGDTPVETPPTTPQVTAPTPPTTPQVTAPGQNGGGNNGGGNNGGGNGGGNSGGGKDK